MKYASLFALFRGRTFPLIYGCLFYSSCFFFIFILDAFFLNRPLFSGPGDGVSSSFFLGLSALIGDPYDVHHQPAYLNSSIAAVIIAITGLPNDNLTSYGYGGLLINLSSVVITGLVLSKLIRDIYFPTYTIFLIGLIVATMPAITGLLQQFSPYFLCSQLITIAIFLSYRIVLRNSNSRLLVFLTFFIFGLAIANLFLSLIIIFGVLISMALTISWKNLSLLYNKFGIFSRLTIAESLLIVGITLFFSLSFKQYFGTSAAPAPLNSWPLELRWLTLVAALSLIIFIFTIHPVIRKYFSLSVRAIYLPTLIGWAIATNIHYPGFGLSLKLSLGHSGSTIFIEDLFSYIIEFTTHANWFILYFLLIALSPFLVRKRLSENRLGIDRQFFIYLILTTLLATLFFAARRDPIIWPQAQTYFSGSPIIHTRYFALAAPIVAFGFSWILSRAQLTSHLRHAVVTVVLVICVLSLVQYTVHIRPLSRYANELEETVESLLSRFPDANLACVDVQMPAYCQILDGYNNTSLLSVGAKRLSKTVGLNGRTIYIDAFEYDCDPNSVANLGCVYETYNLTLSKYFFIFHYRDRNSVNALHDVLWQNSDLRIAVIEVTPTISDKL